MSARITIEFSETISEQEAKDAADALLKYLQSDPNLARAREALTDFDLTGDYEKSLINN